jgi:DNA-binding NarL/FixJ family response regulator
VKPRILVVDDDPLYTEAARTILAQDGRVDVVGCANDGREAVECALALQPDVVLMDIQMPLLDGIEATRCLRRLLPSVRIVLVSASTSIADRRRAREAGAFAAIAKGLGSDALVEAALTAAEAVAPS